MRKWGLRWPHTLNLLSIMWIFSGTTVSRHACTHFRESTRSMEKSFMSFIIIFAVSICHFYSWIDENPKYCYQVFPNVASIISVAFQYFSLLFILFTYFCMPFIASFCIDHPHSSFLWLYVYKTYLKVLLDWLITKSGSSLKRTLHGWIKPSLE